MATGFVAFSLIEFLVLLGSTASSPTHDLVSLIRAEDYFKARNIAVKAEQMVSLALKEPADGKTQVQQLLAIRWLGENPAVAKKAEGARAALEQIAAGKKAQDPQGFARLYARQALARLDDKPVPVAAAPANSVREGCAWFPADTNVVAAVEFRPSSATFSGKADPLREILARFGPEAERKELFKVADALGNVRIDRLAVGQVVDANGDTLRLAVRVTGAIDRKRLLDVLRQFMGKPTVKEIKGAGGEPITLLGGGGRFVPAFALVGDGDLLICPSADKEKNLAVLEQLLAVRAGQQKAALGGVLAAPLKQVSADARALACYDLPEKVRTKLLQEFKALPALPERFLAVLSAERAGDTTKQARVRLHVRGKMKDEAEAKAFVATANQLKEKGLKALDTQPTKGVIPPAVLKALRQSLADLKVEAGGGTVKARVPFPKDEVLFELVKLWLMPRGPVPPVEAPRPPRP
jgi:hypothetical protein